MPNAQTKDPDKAVSPLATVDGKTEGTNVPKPDYSVEEIQYISGLQSRLERARRLRDVRHDEFDGMTFLQHWDLEEKLATTWIPPKINKEDTNFTSGTIRQKIMALLANFANLDLGSDITAYDKDDMTVQGLGDAMEDVVMKVKELDQDDEKKIMRQYELLKHGYVFVETRWEEKWHWAKEVIEPFVGQIDSAKWKKNLKMLYARPTRDILAGPNVYLGDITQYDFNKQPYYYTVRYQSFDDTKAVYGQWERWKFVTKAVAPFAPEAGTGTSSIVYNTWRLTEVRENYVEEVHYFDPFNNEFQVILNGVLMLPIGYPIPEGSALSQQNLEPIHPFFAYGKSLVSRLRTSTAILDEMLKLGVLKTQKSFMPARLNLSGKVLSSRIFMPGKITAGISPMDIPTVDQKETEGVTVPELNFIAELQRNIDSNSVAANFQGQQQSGGPGGGDVTATEVMQLQQQAKLTLGIYTFAVSMLEYKLDWAMVFNLLHNWFNPIDDKLDDARNALKNVYRTVNVKKSIPGKGMGRHLIISMTDNVSPKQVQQAEEWYTQQKGEPHKITVINPDIIKSAKYVWQLIVVPKEKRSSDVSKVMFRAFLADASNPIFLKDLNVPELEERLASVWDENPSKVFVQNINPPGSIPGMNPAPAASGGGPGGGPGPIGAPTPSMQTAKPAGLALPK